MVAVPMPVRVTQPTEGVLVTAARFLGNLVVAAFGVVILGSDVPH